ncbi:MAG: U32 family peptidase [Clostridiales bacterium]|nr:U32 family peptidase [Clostridiales bacterium]
MHKMELLAPVGGMEQLKAAVRFGADAVYGGMKSYGLRAFAGNFDIEQLKEAVDYTHRHHAKFYVTMNILAEDDQLSGMVEAAQQALNCGVDAAIVSDLGVAALLHQQVPQLPIHVSTQANITNAAAARIWRETAGVERIVLSRELSMDQIAAMRKQLPQELELEAFVHGAMCVAYSGRCLLSAALLGRSGNKGACAQPCRWQYHVVEEKRPGEYLPICEDEHGTYLFSSNDLCMLPYLPQLQKAGIASLKIEGRMKTAYYVATVVSAYRQALNILETEGEESFQKELPRLLEELSKTSHRASNTGFYFGQPTPPAGAAGFSQSMEYVGDILSDANPGEAALVRLKNRFFVGDQLEALTPAGSLPFQVSSMVLDASGESVETASVAGTLLRMTFPFSVGAGDLLRGPNRNHL